MRRPLYGLYYLPMGQKWTRLSESHTLTPSPEAPMQTFMTMKERSFCWGIAKVTGEGQRSCELQCSHFKLRGR